MFGGPPTARSPPATLHDSERSAAALTSRGPQVQILAALANFFLLLGPGNAPSGSGGRTSSAATADYFSYIVKGIAVIVRPRESSQ